MYSINIMDTHIEITYPYLEDENHSFENFLDFLESYNISRDDDGNFIYQNVVYVWEYHNEVELLNHNQTNLTRV